MDLTVNDKTYRLEFNHITKLGKHAQLHRGSVKALTICIVTRGKFQRSDASLCSDADHFSRRQGRLRSLRKLLDHSRTLRAIKHDFLTEYLKFDPEPAPPPPPRPKAVMSAEMKAQMKEAGQLGKFELRQRRKEARRVRALKQRFGAAYRQALASVMGKSETAGSSRGPQARA